MQALDSILHYSTARFEYLSGKNKPAEILPQDFPVTFFLTWNLPCQLTSIFSETAWDWPVKIIIFFAVSDWCVMKNSDKKQQQQQFFYFKILDTK